jgi:AbiV family abortive infection protein
VRGARLYQALADASVANARRFLTDGRTLYRRGSTGHACSLWVLAVEEASKAILYKLAAESIIRIVRRKPNNMTTFSEKSLLEHEFKHATLGKLLASAIGFAPFRDALAAARKQSFTRGEAESLLRDAHMRQVVQGLRLAGGSREKRVFDRLFGTLRKLNAVKNLGLYVGHEDGRLLLPHREVRKEVANVRELAEGAVDIAEETVRSRFPSQVRRELALQARTVAAQARRLSQASNLRSKAGRDRPGP